MMKTQVPGVVCGDEQRREHSQADTAQRVVGEQQ